MANDNVKIIINEVDETTPRGSGVSSDVAYIPGLAIDTMEGVEVYVLDEFGNKVPKYYTDENGKKLRATDADGNYIYVTKAWEPVKNTPKLCTTIEEFESYFGDRPYPITQVDIDHCKFNTGYKDGDYDKSYVYAKELLNAGMSVIYENIVAESSLKNIGDFNYIFSQNDQLTSGLKPLVDNGDNTFTYTTHLTEDVETYNITLCFVNNVNLPSSGSAKFIIDRPENMPDLAITTTDPVVVGEKYKDIFNFGVDTETNNCYINWKNASKDDFKFVTFDFVLNVSYVGKEYGDTYNIGINLVNNDDYLVNSDSQVISASKIQNFYNGLKTALNRIEDKSEYSVKYITSGGYPTFFGDPLKPEKDGYADLLINTAENRGDAVAIIDHVDDASAPLNRVSELSMYSRVNLHFANCANGEFGTAFTPWGRYSCVTVPEIDKSLQLMPPSFGYLLAVAKAIKTSPNHLAMAGVSRGIVPNLKSLNVDNILTNAIAEDYQPKYGKEGNSVSLNAITNIKPYGLTIWGNRTLKKVDERGTVALNFLNIRNMVSDIKKVSYSTAKKLMFEQDSDTLWLKFKSGISPLLDQLKSGNGISDYKIIRGKTKYNGQALTRGEIAAVIKIFPMYAVEYFEITVVMADNDVTIS